MNANDSSSQQPGPPSGLGELLGFALRVDEDWTPAELGAVLREQISDPMAFSLAAFTPDQARTVHAHAAAQGLVLRSIGDLLAHPKPPLELIMMAKDHFKANATNPHPGLPAEVARVLYYLALAAALVRHRRRISSLSEAQLAHGWGYVTGQSWVPTELQRLAAVAKQALTAGEPANDT